MFCDGAELHPTMPVSMNTPPQSVRPVSSSSLWLVVSDNISSVDNLGAYCKILTVRIKQSATG
jgi:hypothetical protein